MAIVITNGNYYIYLNENGKHRKTADINKAIQYESVGEAIRYMKKAPTKTEGYYVFDTVTKHILWKWMTQKEQDEVRKNKMMMQAIKRDKNGKIKRKSYSDDVRKLIYLNAGCRCELCGKKLLFEDMTIDHVVPLSMGGADTVENLQCVCWADNQFKGNILPDDFLERISSIFMYQMEKRNHGLKWRIVHKLLMSLGK